MISCLFCKIIRKEETADIIYEDENTIAFLDKYPQSRGHLQLVPKKHYRWIYELPDIGNFFTTAQRLIRVIIPTLGADHVTMATFGHEVKHAHLWIVPQYLYHKSIQERVLSVSRKEDLNTIANMLRKRIREEVHLEL